MAYNSNPERLPILEWISPNHLQIIVPNLSLIGLKKNSYEGVEISVNFVPNDPAAREHWLNELGIKANP